jgi:hypothetical protein
MKQDLEDLKKQLKADFALTWGLQADTNRRLEAVEQTCASLSQTVEGQNELSNHQAETLQRQAELTQRLFEGARRQTELLGQQAVGLKQLKSQLSLVTENGRRIEGHLRHKAERFDVFLNAVINESASVTDLTNLEARIESRFIEIERRLSA